MRDLDRAEFQDCLRRAGKSGAGIYDPPGLEASSIPGRVKTDGCTDTPAHPAGPGAPSAASKWEPDARRGLHNPALPLFLRDSSRRISLGRDHPIPTPLEHLGTSSEQLQPCRSRPDPSLIQRGLSRWIPGISKGVQPDVSGVKPRSRFSLANGIKVPGTGAWSLPDFLVPPENREHFWLLFPTIKPAGFEPMNPKFQPSPRSKARLPTAGNSTSGIILGNNRCQRSAAPSGTWLCRCGSSIPPIRLDFLNIQE